MSYVGRIGSTIRDQVDKMRGRPPAFDREIEKLVQAHLTGRERDSIPTELYAKLGCHSIPRCFEEEKIVEEGEQAEGFIRRDPAAKNEPLVCRTLLLALRSHLTSVRNTYSRSNDGFCILDGFTQPGRWGTLLQHENDAYAIAELLAWFANCSPNYDDARQQIETKLCPVLNEWLKPEVSFQSYPSMEILTRAMFGGSWYDIVGSAEDKTQWNVPALIRSQRPPFLPGLIASNLAEAPMSLPELQP
jgi:hypothetical protein